MAHPSRHLTARLARCSQVDLSAPMSPSAAALELWGEQADLSSSYRKSRNVDSYHTHEKALWFSPLSVYRKQWLAWVLRLNYTFESSFCYNYSFTCICDEQHWDPKCSSYFFFSDGSILHKQQIRKVAAVQSTALTEILRVFSVCVRVRVCVFLSNLVTRRLMTTTT